MHATATLDAKGLNCPLPVLKAQKALKDLGAGEVLKVIATDPGSVKDFASFCEATGNGLADSNEAGGVYTFMIKKGG